jgi:prolyl oligopeptidase
LYFSGLLVAASVIRAPEGTFGAAVAEVGVHDYLKVCYLIHLPSPILMSYLQFHRFTIGRAWTADYGNPDDPTDFDFMHPISPVHNVPTNKVLPPMMLHTADRVFSDFCVSLLLTTLTLDDDRVVPLHSFKLAAALQHAAPENEHPLLLRIEKKAGHGAGKSTEQRHVFDLGGGVQDTNSL